MNLEKSIVDGNGRGKLFSFRCSDSEGGPWFKCSEEASNDRKSVKTAGCRAFMSLNDFSLLK